MERPSSPEPGRRWGFRRPRRLRTIALLPTLITLGNGICGVMAIFKIGMGMTEHLDKHFTAAGWLILVAMVYSVTFPFPSPSPWTSRNERHVLSVLVLVALAALFC